MHETAHQARHRQLLAALSWTGAVGLGLMVAVAALVLMESMRPNSGGFAAAIPSTTSASSLPDPHPPPTPDRPMQTAVAALVALARPTATATALPTRTPMPVPTSVPWCDGGPPAGSQCEWPRPTIVPTAYPICNTPEPAATCRWEGAGP